MGHLRSLSGVSVSLLCIAVTLAVTPRAFGQASPILYYSFDDAGNPWRDDSGNGHTLSVSGSYSLVPGAMGNAVYFDSNSLTGPRTSTSGLDYPGTGGFSVEYMVQVGSTTGTMGVRDYWAGVDCGEVFGLRYYDSTDKADFFVRHDFSPPTIIEAPVSTSDGDWVHLLGTYDPHGYTMSLYIDGVLANQGNMPAPMRTSIPPYFYVSGSAHGTQQAAVDEVRLYNAAITPAPPLGALPGSVEAIGARQLHERGLDGTAVKIGMVESGGLPWTQHPALQENVLNGEAVKADASDHATGVAGIMVGLHIGADVENMGRDYRGVAPGAALQAAHAVYSVDIGNRAADLSGAGCDVINISCATSPDNWPVANEVNRTIDDIVDSDRVTVVAAAGNGGPTHPIMTPANAYNVITAGSLESCDLDVYWRGPWDGTGSENVPGPTTADYNGTRRCKPDIVAPGNCMLATHQADYYGPYLPGDPPSAYSSLAAPHVTGAVALMIQAARNEGVYFLDGDVVDPRAVKSALLTSANKRVVHFDDTPWVTSGPGQPLDYELGAGGLNALEAVDVLLGRDTGGQTRHMAADKLRWDESEVTGSLGVLDPGTMVVASLVWNAHVQPPSVQLNNLDLLLKRVEDSQLIASSLSTVDNVEHIYAPSLEHGGTYQLVVVNSGLDSGDIEDFALSWRIIPRGRGQENALLPSAEPEPGHYVFEGVESGSWIDPESAVGFRYVAKGGSLITEIMDFPMGFRDPFQVLADDTLFGYFQPGDSLDFASILGEGVAEFTLMGINPAVGFDEHAFPIQLAFSTPSADLEMYAIVPEPATLSLLALGGLAALLRSRR